MRVWGVVGLLVVGACVKSPSPELVPMVEPKEPTAVEWQGPAKLSVQSADGSLVGEIKEMSEYWLYDDPCGLIMILRHGCDGTSTYQIKIANDSTNHWVYAFTPSYGTFGLHVGLKAVYLWHGIVAYRYQECRDRQAMTSAYCNYDRVDAFQSDFDVLPVADSAKVDSLRKAIR